jgi:hypothetical protein
MTGRNVMLGFVVCVCLCFVTACQTGRSAGGSKSSIKDSITNRSIERTRLHDAAELKEAHDAAAEDSDEALLLFMNALLLVEEDQTAGYAAVAYMSRPNDQWQDAGGPTGVKPSKMAEEGLRRIRDRPEIVRSYTGGAGSGYKLANPETVKLSIKETRDEASDRVKYFIWSAGKDNASPITLRAENGRWYVDEWSSIQTGVR